MPFAQVQDYSRSSDLSVENRQIGSGTKTMRGGQRLPPTSTRATMRALAAIPELEVRGRDARDSLSLRRDARDPIQVRRERASEVRARTVRLSLATLSSQGCFLAERGPRGRRTLCCRPMSLRDSAVLEARSDPHV